MIFFLFIYINQIDLDLFSLRIVTIKKLIFKKHKLI